jgi:hypothetical protein
VRAREKERYEVDEFNVRIPTVEFFEFGGEARECKSNGQVSNASDGVRLVSNGHISWSELLKD